jgi:microcystin-dependent protein
MSNQHIDFLPKGSIIMWYGKSTEIPNGWAICDGSHNSKFGREVPDLRKRFVVGAESDDGSNTYGLGKTGGVETVALTENQMPSHSHSGKAQTTNIEKKSSIYVRENMKDKVPQYKYIDKDGGDFRLMHPDAYTRGFQGGSYASYDSGGNNNGTPRLGDCIKMEHDHTLSIDNAGGGQAHENRPPYLALYYIIKVADELQ